MLREPNLKKAIQKYPNVQWKNLYEETLRIINKFDHTTNNVSWVGTTDGEYAISWEEYRQISDITYNSNFGGTNIPRDLVVVFSDKNWLERREYDGAEWWKYVSTPQKSSSPHKFTLTIDKEGSFIGPRYQITVENEKYSTARSQGI